MLRIYCSPKQPGRKRLLKPRPNPFKRYALFWGIPPYIVQGNSVTIRYGIALFNIAYHKPHNSLKSQVINQ